MEEVEFHLTKIDTFSQWNLKKKEVNRIVLILFI